MPRFSNVGPERRHLGSCGVRFEGIDTLETHFENQHQDLTHAVAARDQMLELMGFGQVEFWADLLNEIKTAQHHRIATTCAPTASNATAASWAWSISRSRMTVPVASPCRG